tara:strand:- start:1058 stop:1891 length:834 start_codon:yes stop_codon:yes gene_type:complete
MSDAQTPLVTFGSLFAGIGGIDLGLERAGMTCAWQVEIDPWCRKVLAKHWPDVRRYEDVKTVGGDTLEPVALIAGGFPCQDVSVAGQRAGIQDGTRSGLWSEFHRIICELRPRYVFVENVPGLLTNGMGRVLGDLAEIGYDAEWEVLSAADVGAPHLRKRVFIVADADDAGLETAGKKREVAGREIATGHVGSGSSAVADTDSSDDTPRHEQTESPVVGSRRPWIGNQEANWWTTEPDVGRVANGVPQRVDRLKGLGNAVVPQCAEQIGRRIMEQFG